MNGIRQFLPRARRVVIRRTAQVAWKRISEADRARLARQILPLQLDDLFECCEIWTEDHGRILESVGLETGPELGLQYEVAARDISKRSAQASFNYPLKYDIASRTERLLFDFVRKFQPALVVETGIANGRSSAIILAAMDLNGCGKLHSIDIRNDVGALVPDGHPRWQKHITDGSIHALTGVFDSLDEVDLFIHDGDHCYTTQMREYMCALEHASQRGFIASDDVNWSYAFYDFCLEHKLSPLVLSDVNKYFGIVRVKHPAN